jgi:hypothetical protein
MATVSTVTDVTTHRMCNTTHYEGEYVDSLSAVDSTEKADFVLWLKRHREDMYNIQNNKY